MRSPELASESKSDTHRRRAQMEHTHTPFGTTQSSSTTVSFSVVLGIFIKGSTLRAPTYILCTFETGDAGRSQASPTTLHLPSSTSGSHHDQSYIPYVVHATTDRPDIHGKAFPREGWLVSAGFGRLFWRRATALFSRFLPCNNPWLMNEVYNSMNYGIWWLT